ncbi:hypothetical protein LCGC14_0176240 [marine sediment metagenome]|uniref:DUF4326 domain-containing protein n=1 Tax=marine sediment metagenome TaxID=412755 RepID=A0A0F9URI5_9ZZZZ
MSETIAIKRIKWNRFMGKLPTNTKIVTRRSRWGNPFNLSEHTRGESLKKYRKWLRDQIQADKQFIEPLKGYNLACGCDITEKCHADIILEFFQCHVILGIKDVDQCLANNPCKIHNCGSWEGHCYCPNIWEVDDKK